MSAAREPNIGDWQVGNSSEYADMAPGFVVEEYGIHGWAIPDWVERSLPHLEGVFASAAAAHAAIRS